PTVRSGTIPPSPSCHRLQPGLPVYLIPFAPLSFAPQRQFPPRTLPSPLVFLRISTHFTTPPGILCPSEALKSERLPGTPLGKRGAGTGNASPHLRALYAQ